ncbi:MFS transporter [Massilia endophytica]|uniref:MFS transporter n=1 Tax=Massilia endophytica TaxID=2899220 RepID=UPI001E2AECAD|nr:MFS transporter [Massilia endophytica]UGQ45179.1 MFS transporter [Massilia endophytica]
MTAQRRARRLFLLECLLVYFAVGMFYILPLFVARQGHDEMQAAQLIGAGAVGAIACSAGSAWLVRRAGLRRLAPLGSAIFALGALLFAAGAWAAAPLPLLFLASLIQGWGWGLCFTLQPLCMASASEAPQRAPALLLLGAVGSIGSGAAPLVADMVLDSAPGAFAWLFLAAAACSAAAFFLCRRGVHLAGDARLPPWDRAAHEVAAANRAISGAAAVLRWPGAAFYIMVALAACTYTSMVNFQTGFAAAQSQRFGVFFLWYTVAAIAARFAAAWLGRRCELARLLPLLIGLVLAGLALLALAGRSAYFYAAGAFLLGGGYGLAYPLMQAQAIAHAPPGGAPAAMSVFSMSYLVPRYGFPFAAALLVAGGGYEALLAVLACGTAIALGLSLLSR